MKKLALIMIAVLLIAGIVYWQTRPRPVAVKVARVEFGPVAKTVANTRVGRIKACRRALLSPQQAGAIAELPVHEGMRVEPGQLLLRLWNDNIVAQLDLARQEKRVAEAKREQACTQVAHLNHESARVERLFKRQLISEDKLEQARAKAAAGRAACRAAQASLSAASAKIATVEAARRMTELRAPFAGVIAEVNGEVGEYVTPSPPGIATLPTIDLIDDRCLLVSAPIDEVDAPLLATGMPACISLDAFPDKLCGARVSRIAPYVLDREKQARTVEIEVTLPSGPDMPHLLAGYSADVEVEVTKKTHALRIPTEAVLEGNRVYRYDATSETIEQRKIEAGISNWQYTEVLSGLSEGDQVVTSVAREGVGPGVRVTLEQQD